MMGGWREFDAGANGALTRFYSRTGWEPVETRMPFDDLLAAESDGEDGEVGEYEMRQRMAGVRAFFKFLQSRGPHPASMLKMMAAAGRACQVAPFAAMTMEELGEMFGETKAAHSWRCKLLSREIKLAGMHGAKLPGQKSEEASESYRRVRQRNRNRAGKISPRGGKPHKPKKGPTHNE